MSHLLEAIQILDGAVENLRQASRRDDKTSLLNGMALEQDARQIGTVPTSPDVVVFGDLNRFKQINDQYGHFDDCMTNAYRRSGDEFVIVLKKEKLDVFKEKQLSSRSVSCASTMSWCTSR